MQWTCAPTAESHTLHFHQMHHYRPEVLDFLPKLRHKPFFSSSGEREWPRVGQQVWRHTSWSRIYLAALCTRNSQWTEKGQRGHGMKAGANPDVILSYCQEESIINGSFDILPFFTSYDFYNNKSQPLNSYSHSLYVFCWSFHREPGWNWAPTRAFRGCWVKV